MISWTVPQEEEGLRLDRTLTTHVPNATRTQAKRWIEEGRVTVARRPARPARLLRAGERVEVTVPAPKPAELEPEAIPLDVVYEDAALLVVNKPPGMVVHPAAGHRTGTLVNALLHHCTALSGIGGVLRPGIVHRLDRGTSGLLVVAKTDAAHQALSRQFAERTVEKRYVALVRGATPARFRMEKPIGRDLRDRKKISSRSRRPKPAASEAQRLEAFPGATLVDVHIETGRTHQIRVHLAEAGHPVIGDPTYGSRRPGPSEPILARLKRPALHARVLAFVHPGTRVPMRFETPLPEDILEVLTALRGMGR